MRQVIQDKLNPLLGSNRDFKLRQRERSLARTIKMEKDNFQRQRRSAKQGMSVKPPQSTA